MNRCPNTLDMFSPEGPAEPAPAATRKRHTPPVSQTATRLYPAYDETSQPQEPAPEPRRHRERAPFQKHSVTSAAASAEISPKLVGLRLKMLEELRRHPRMQLRWEGDGMTDNEIIAHFVAKGWNPNTPRARRIELVQGGYLAQNGTKGKSALWVLTERGMQG